MTQTVSGLCSGCMSSLGDYTVCPHCGYDNAAEYDNQYRKPQSILGGRYIIGRLVRKNGEGALYVGYDNNVHDRVWIREYFPPNLAVRDITTGNILPKENCGAQFKALLADFVDLCGEVKRLSATEPVIPVLDVVPEMGTAYAIYKSLPVVALETWLVRQGGKITAGEARELILPLLNSLSNIHSRGMIHRGISPYTVYIDKNGKLYLWDFSLAATRTGGCELLAELFNGYSAPEQYSSNGWQGTWTDVYSSAALFYRMVSGFVPPKSTLIGPQRPLAPLSDLVVDLPANISEAVSDSMNFSAQNRTQEIGIFVSRLVQTDLGSTAVYDTAVVQEAKMKSEQKKAIRAEKRRRGKYIFLGLLVTIVMLGLGVTVLMKTYFPSLMSNADDERSRPDSQITSPLDSEDENEDESSSQDDRALPNFMGLTAEQVTADDQYKGRYNFSVVEDFDSRFEAGVIYDQAPTAGTTLENGRTVVLYVSKGKQMIIMPELIGLTRDEAVEALQEACGDQELPPYNTYDKFSPDAKPGTVVSTSPVAGSEFDAKDVRINIFFMPEEEELSSSKSESSQKESSSKKSSSSKSSSKSSSSKKSSSSGRTTVDDFLSEFHGNN